MKKEKLISKENMIRFLDENLQNEINDFYIKNERLYVSKNQMFNELIKMGLAVAKKELKDNWAFNKEKQTIMDAILEQTKRLNFFIKFSKPFIKTCYANSEINQKLLNRLYKNMNDSLYNTPITSMDYDRGKWDNLQERLKTQKEELMAKYDEAVD